MGVGRRPRRTPVTLEGTAVGNVDSAWYGTVDGRGRIAAGGAWTLDWWVGAEDRWHLPGREVAVRQRRLEDTPVVETAMRVPSGDVVHRAYGALVGGIDVVAVEVENQSPLPVALALAIEPGHVRSVLEDADGALVDGAQALVWAKPPSRRAVADGDVEPVVTGGDAGADPARGSSRRGRMSAAFIWPLPHRQTLRFVVPRPGTSGLGSVTVPTAAQVVRGWQVHAGRGLRAVLPDPRRQSELAGARYDALLEQGWSADPAVAATLDELGLPDEAATVLRRVTGPDVVEALAWHWQLHRDTELAVELAPTVAAAAEVAARRKQRTVLDAAAVALRGAGEDVAATDAERHAGSLPTQAGRVASRLAELRDALVAETAVGLDLCRTWPSAWYGAALELHDAPTAWGRVSFAVRWHGERPALLWELEPWPDAPPAVLRAPGLDPAWSSTAARGDALLAPVPAPGVPVTLRRS